MRGSAEYFGRPFPEERIRELLAEVRIEIMKAPAPAPAAGARAAAVGAAASAAVATVRNPAVAARVALSLDAQGGVESSWEWLEPAAGAVRLLLATECVDPADVFLYHKTSLRSVYDRNIRAATAAGYFDMLYLNRRGQVAECGRASVAIKLEGAWVTPPLRSGLLPGIWRRRLLEGGGVTERVIRLADVGRAEQIMVGNAARGTIEVERVDHLRRLPSDVDVGIVVWPRGSEMPSMTVFGGSRRKEGFSMPDSVRVRFRPKPHRRSPCRRCADRHLQLGVRSSKRRRVHPAHRRHRPRTLDRGEHGADPPLSRMARNRLGRRTRSRRSLRSLLPDGARRVTTRRPCEHMKANGSAYPCFCSAEELKTKRSVRA